MCLHQSEGRTLWILGKRPSRPRELFGAKGVGERAMSDARDAGACFPVVWLGLSAPDALALLALCVCMGLFIPVAGLAVNLWLPRPDRENDTIVVKQSASINDRHFRRHVGRGLGSLLWAVGGKLLGLCGSAWPRPRCCWRARRWAGIGCAVPARGILQKL